MRQLLILENAVDFGVTDEGGNVWIGVQMII